MQSRHLKLHNGLPVGTNSRLKYINYKNTTFVWLKTRRHDTVALLRCELVSLQFYILFLSVFPDTAVSCIIMWGILKYRGEEEENGNRNNEWQETGERSERMEKRQTLRWYMKYQLLPRLCEHLHGSLIHMHVLLE